MGGQTEKPKKVIVAPPTKQVLETSADDPKGSMSTKYENQSEHLSISIHNHTNLCGTTARAENSTRIIREDTAKELQDHVVKTQDTLVDAVENAEAAEEINDGVNSYNSAISTCENCKHSEVYCVVERQCNEAERGPRAPGEKDLKAPMLSEQFICRCHDGCLVQDCEELRRAQDVLTDMRLQCGGPKTALVPRVGDPICGAGCGEVSAGYKVPTGLFENAAGLRPGTEGLRPGLRPETQGERATPRPGRRASPRD